MQGTVVGCRSCGCTGEDYIPALAGDGWTNRRCSYCNGFGTKLVIGSEVFLFVDPYHYPEKNIYRGNDGQFKSLAEVEILDG